MKRQPAKNETAVEAKRRWVRNGELAKYLGISKMTLWRLKHDPEHKSLNFPPAAKINDIEFNDLTAVDAWMEARVTRVTP